MRKEIIEIYTFEELSESAKEKAIEDNRDINIFHDWFEFILDMWKEKLHEIGFESADIRFGSFYSQGGGASFESDVNIEKIFSSLVYHTGKDFKNTDLNYFEKFLNLQDNGMIDTTFWSKRISSYYSHENTCTVDCELDLYLENYSCIGENWFYDTLDKIAEDIESYRHELCQIIFQDLQDEYEYLTGDEAIKEALISNEYEFLKDGSTY